MIFFSENLLRSRLPFSLRLQKMVVAVVSAFILFLIIPPISMLLFSTFRSTKGRLPFEATSFTLNNLFEVFGSPVTYKLLAHTAAYAVGAVSLSLALAIVFSWFIERTDMPFRRFFFMLILLPMGIPGIVISMAWILFTNPNNGLLNVFLRTLFGLEGSGPLDIYSLPGMILVTALRFVPLEYLMISGVFGRLDPTFEEAGYTSGAKTWTTFRRISLPLLSPALFAAMIYFLVLGIEVFETAAMLGMPKRIFVFSTMIYYAVNPKRGLPDYGLASAYGTILLAVAATFIYIYARYVRHAERFATVTGRGYRPRLIKLKRWRVVPIVLFSGYFVFAVALPFLILLWTSVAPRFAPLSFATLSNLNLDAYRRMVAYPDILRAVKNTLIIASASASGAMLLTTLASWLSVRKAIPGAWIPERFSFAVLGVPGVVLGIALIFLYTFLPLPLYGTLWIIVIALITMCLPYGTRLMNAAFLQIHRELEEAAATSGARMASTFRRIILPLLWPSFTRGFLWIFVRSISEVTVALMLFAAGNQTLVVVLWFLWQEEGDFPLFSAISVPMVIVLSIFAYGIAKQTMLQEKG